MNKKAFTLTELLVVVVIIGVLSAVVLPKFTKILQTRKTAEAENILTAVRNEQEARCMVGRDYVGAENIGRLASLPVAARNNQSQNYTYSLNTKGITASAKDGDYELQIPSYTDGRICCHDKVPGSGACAKLNKNYPYCEDASFKNTLLEASCETPEDIPDDPPDDPIVPDDPEEPCDKTPYDGECENGVIIHYGVNDNCEYVQESTSVCACDESKRPETTQNCTPDGYTIACGRKTRTVKCDSTTNYEWQAPNWSEISCEETDECSEELVSCDDLEEKFANANMLSSLDEACTNAGRGPSDDTTSTKRLPANATWQQFLNVCCGECCASGMFDKSGNCIACEDLGTNFWLEKLEGECGKCASAFKPEYLENKFIAYSGTSNASQGSGTGPWRVLTNYTIEREDCTVYKPVIKGTEVAPYTNQPCSTCDPQADTCDEVGYGPETAKELKRLNQTYPSEKRRIWISQAAGAYEFIEYTIPAGYQPGTARLSQDHFGKYYDYNSVVSAARSGGFTICDHLPDGYRSELAEHYVWRKPTKDFEVGYAPRYKEVSGYRCVRNR